MPDRTCRRMGWREMKLQFQDWLMSLIAKGDVHPFYVCTEWLHIRVQVLKMDHWECQLCKARGRYRQAEIVHHINHLKRRPDLALAIWYKTPDGKLERNLISVCKDCHETECHPERLNHSKTFQNPLTVERWD